MDAEPVTLFGGKVEYIPVVFKEEWMGNPKGHSLKLNREKAEQLIQAGIAKRVERASKDKMLRQRKVKTK